MNMIGQKSLLVAFALALALSYSAAASAQHAPDAHAQQNAPAQQTMPAQQGQGMGHDAMDHGKMGAKGMDGEHGRMGSGMKQGGASDTTATKGANPPANSNAAPPSGSK